MPTPLPSADERSDSQRRGSHGPQPARSPTWELEKRHKWGKISLHSRDGDGGRRACEDAGSQLLSGGQLCRDFWFWPPKEKLTPTVCVTVHEAHRSENKGFCLVFFFFFFLRYSQAYLLLKEYCSHFTNCCLLVSLLLKNKIHWANLKIELALFNSSWFSQRPIKQGEVCSKEPHQVKGLSSVWFGLGFPLFTVKLLGKWRGHLCCQCLCKNNNFITTLGPEEVCYLKPGTSWS